MGKVLPPNDLGRFLACRRMIFCGILRGDYAVFNNSSPRNYGQRHVEISYTGIIIFSYGMDPIIPGAIIVNKNGNCPDFF